MFTSVLLVDIGFLLGTLGRGLPVAAQLIVNQVKRGQISPLCPWEFLHYFLHEVLVHALSNPRIVFFRGGARHYICFVDLPANIGGAVYGFTRAGRVWGILGGPG